MYYWPEMTGNAPYTAGIAEALAARGDEVIVVAGLPHYPDWRIPPGFGRSLVQREQRNGVTVIRAAHYVPRRQSAIGRSLYEATFGLTGLLAGLALPRPDAILGIVPNLSSGVLARLLAARYRAPYGLLFQNLMGPGARQSGIEGGATVAAATALAELWATRGARRIGVVAEGFTPYLVRAGVPSARIIHVPNWTRGTAPEMGIADTRDWFGWGAREQVVLHAGNLGLMQGLDQIVDAARLAEGRGDPIRFVFSGGGSQSDAIQTAAKGLRNVSFLGLQPDGAHASLLRAADVLLISERESQIEMSLPSKLTSYFAAGRPIVAAVSSAGGTARELDRSSAGLVVPAGEPDRLLDALARLREDAGLVSELSAQGPAYAEAHTSEAVCLARAVALVRGIAESGAPPTTGGELAA
jgi:glycosyltransferase involved in cell wall biosynthesis